MKKVWIDRFYCYEGFLFMKGYEMLLIVLFFRDWILIRKCYVLSKFILEIVSVVL